MNLVTLISTAAIALSVATIAPAQDSFGGGKPAAQPATQPAAPRSGAPAQPAQPGQPAQKERADAGTRSGTPLHSGPMHGNTPASVPGGQLITTQALSTMLKDRQPAHLLFDVLGGQETLPSALSAAWMSQPGDYADAVQQRVVQSLRQVTQGRNDVALIFYCASEQCWMSYNAALRAINAGYTNVRWYRGGLEAWKAAGLPTQAVQGF